MMLEAEVVPAPEGWAVEPFVCVRGCTRQHDGSQLTPKNVQHARHCSVLRRDGQVGWIDDYLFDEELVLLGEDGAPFLDKSKPIAYVIEGQSWVNNHAHVLRARSRHVE